MKTGTETYLEIISANERKYFGGIVTERFVREKLGLNLTFFD